jgi:predicted permease
VRPIPESPRLARTLLTLALPRDVRDEIVGDLEEVFQRRCLNNGAVGARIWYYREALSFAARFQVDRLGEHARMPRGATVMSISRDTRESLRAFARKPLLSATILGSIAVGIGANVALFSVLNALVLRPLPVRDPASLFQIVHAGDAGASASSAYAFYEHLQNNAKTIDGAFLADTSTTKAIIDGQAESIVAQQVTPGYFEVLGVRPHIGAVFQTLDRSGQASTRAAVISHHYWVRRFASDPGILGRTIVVDRVAHTIAGVAPARFVGLDVSRPVDVTVLLDGTRERQYWQSKDFIVRLAPGSSRQQAMLELNPLFHGYVSQHGSLSQTVRDRGFKWLDLESARSGLPELRDRYGTPLKIALAIMLALLLLACANLAGLFLARATDRRRDFAICLALGASRGRLARQLFCESLLFAAAGGVLGVLVAAWGTDAIVTVLADFGLSPALNLDPDLNVLTFTVAASLLTGLSIGVAPAWSMKKVGLNQVLAATGRTVGAARGPFNALIVAQLAVSIVLVVGAMLFATTLSNLKAQPLGFVPGGVLLMTLDADGTDLEGERLGLVHRHILEKLEALPGVVSATFATIPPMSSNVDGKPFSIPGVTFPTPDDGVLQVNTVGPRFFETFGIRLLRGRAVVASDNGTAPKVAVVSESMARYYFPGEDAIGRRVDVGRGRGGQIEIVGIAEDVRYKNLRTPAPRMAYVPALQREAEEESTFAIRMSGDPVSWAAAAVREIKNVAPGIPATDVITLARQRDKTVATERLLASLSLGFGALALALVGIGVYGMVGYTVSQRTAELGLRIALGAGRATVLWLIIREVLILISIAVAIGLTASYLAGSLVSAFLFGVQPAAPWVYAATLVVMVVTGVAATLAPTIRATRIDPIETLRAH